MDNKIVVQKYLQSLVSDSEYQRRAKVRRTSNFSKTNKIWNDLQLNYSWNIGYTTLLFNQKLFTNHKEWEQYYYKSGEERLRIMNVLTVIEQKNLKTLNITHDGTRPIPDEDLYNQSNIRSVYNYNCLSKLNSEFGRTESELIEIAGIMYNYIKNETDIRDITMLDCIDYTKIRILDEIHIGVFREILVLDKLKREYPNILFLQPDSRFDARYAVDCEMYIKNRLVGALQIKSTRHMNTRNHNLRNVREYNQKKYKKYEELTNVEVKEIYANESGEVQNTQIFRYINSLVLANGGELYYVPKRDNIDYKGNKGFTNSKHSNKIA